MEKLLRLRYYTLNTNSETKMFLRLSLHKVVLKLQAPLYNNIDITRDGLGISVDVPEIS